MGKTFVLGLATVTALLAIFFSWRLLDALFSYKALIEGAEPAIRSWEIKQMGEKFALQANYTFQAGGSHYQGMTLLSKPWYLNESAAVEALQKEVKKNWSVWFNPADPKESTLEKQFPTLLLGRMFLCYSLSIYFFIYFVRLKKYYN